MARYPTGICDFATGDIIRPGVFEYDENGSALTTVQSRLTTAPVPPGVYCYDHRGELTEGSSAGFAIDSSIHPEGG